jgi:hypothetical protein
MQIKKGHLADSVAQNMHILYNNVSRQRNTGVICMFNVSLTLNDIGFKTLEKKHTKGY